MRKLWSFTPSDGRSYATATRQYPLLKVKVRPTRASRVLQRTGSGYRGGRACQPITACACVVAMATQTQTSPIQPGSYPSLPPPLCVRVACEAQDCGALLEVGMGGSRVFLGRCRTHDADMRRRRGACPPSLPLPAQLMCTQTRIDPQVPIPEDVRVQAPPCLIVRCGNCHRRVLLGVRGLGGHAPCLME